MRTAVIFDNLGPYHRARLRAGTSVCDLLAVEVASESSEYPWVSQSTVGFRKVTILHAETSRTASRWKILSGIDEVLRHFQPAVVFIPGWSSLAAFGAMRWCTRNQVPAAVMSESTAWDEQRRTWKERVKRGILKFFSVALVGGEPHAEYVHSLGMPLERIFRGYDVVDNDYFRGEAEAVNSSNAEEIRNRHGLPKQYFLASARFVAKKNLPRLLEAYAQYRKLCAQKISEPWGLVLLGDGELRQSLCSLRNALALDAYVLMPGFKQHVELPVYYGLAHAFIHASTSEPWGLVVNEAMASGLPVLVSNCCGCAFDLVQPGYNGFTFDPYETKQLAHLMIKLTLMPETERKQFGINSQRSITNWGPGAFARGMRSAAEMALRVSCPQVSVLDRLALEALSYR